MKNEKLPKQKNWIFFSNSDFKNHFFWTILFENLKILSFLAVWILKEPISTKKSFFLKILHPHAKPLWFVALHGSQTVRVSFCILMYGSMFRKK
jgi:hypothetical protein